MLAEVDQTKTILINKGRVLKMWQERPTWFGTSGGGRPKKNGNHVNRLDLVTTYRRDGSRQEFLEVKNCRHTT